MAKKEQPKFQRNTRETPITITKQIDINFRNYALYVLEHRGIPGFYDALTNVQRVILMNAPKSYNKTISLVGSCISDGYHHGDCLDYSTPIHLADGNTISIGEWATKYPDQELLVYCKNDEGDLDVSVGHSPRIGQITDEVYEIELEDGEIIKCTGNHPFFVNGEWIKAEDLTADMDILDYR